MPRVAILGSNGQVGAEVCLHLFRKQQVEIDCFVRSKYSSYLLRSLGVPCHVLDLATESSSDKQLADYDVIVDFTYPSGNAAESLERVQTQIDRVAAGAGRGAKIVLMSSLMAFGMPAHSKSLANHYFSNTTYAFIKRTAERQLMKASRKYQVVPFAIRLGEVHGRLQSVSAGLRQQLTNRQISVQNAPNDLSICVFASSVAEAISNIANGTVDPGISSLVCSPQWTLEELYKFYQDDIDSPTEVVFSGGSTVPRKRNRLSRSLFKLATKHRQLLEIGILMRSQKLSRKAKGLYRCANSSSLPTDVLPSAHKIEHMVGAVPGRSISDIRSRPAEVRSDTNECDHTINQLFKSCLT